jgi:arsenate reductase
MTMKLFHYQGCSTCRKARAWLAAKGLHAVEQDLVANPPDAATLRDLWQRSGKPLARFFNVSGQSYRDGGFAARLPTMDDAARLAALAADGKLVKRPILDTGTQVLVGFDAAAWGEALGGGA